MERTLLEILPLAVAATISPSGLLFVTIILSGKENPRRHALLFLLGAVTFLIAMLMISFPVIITILMPKKSGIIMVPVKSFMSKHGSAIAKGYFLFVAVYLIFHGIRELQAG